MTDDGCARLAGGVTDGIGHGITGMRERASVYGGRLIAEPTAAASGSWSTPLSG